MARYIVSSGVVSSGIILHKDSMYVLSSGIAVVTTVNSSGYLKISSGGVTNNTVVSGGRLFISNGGMASNTTVNRGSMSVSSGGVANDTILTYGGHLDIFSGGMANNTTVNSYGYLDISSGGVANDTILTYGGHLDIFSGGVANNATVSRGGQVRVCSGGFASGISAKEGAYLDLTVASNTYIQGSYAGSAFEMKDAQISGYTVHNGYLYVSDGGVANDTTVNYNGYLRVSSGASALAIKENGGFVYVADGAKVSFVANTFNGVVVLSYCSATVHSGTTALNTTVNDSGHLSVFSGGVTNHTTINSGGRLHVSDGGVANDTTVNAGGYLSVNCGGSALNVIWTPCVGTISVEEGAYVTYASSYSGVYFGSANQLLSHTDSMNGKTVSGYTCSMYVMNGGVANNTTISDWLASMTISSGGVANHTNVNGSGIMTIYSGGVANHTVVSGGGYLSVFSGGVASNTIVSGGGLYVSDGGVANNTVMSGGCLYVSDGGVANNTVMSGGCLYVSSGGVANDTVMSGGGYLSVFSGGVASNTIVNGGRLRVCGVASDTTISGGGCLYVSSGGVASNTIVSRGGGGLHVSSGGVASDTTISGGGCLYVFSGGMASDTTVDSSGCLFVFSGAMLNDLTLKSGGQLGGFSFARDLYWNKITDGVVTVSSNVTILGNQMTISRGGVANNTSVNSRGELYVSSGGVTNQATVLGHGLLYVFSGGVANNTTLSGYYYEGYDSGYGRMAVSSGSIVNDTTIKSYGMMAVSSGGTVKNTTVNSNGCLYLFNGGIHTGTLNVANSATVTVFAGSVIDFTVSGQSAPRTALVSNWGVISGGNDASYTITVAADQRQGTYVLASNASMFDKIITVKTTDNVTLGTLAVNEEKVLGNQTYSLTKNANTLTLTVGTSSVKPAVSDYNKSGRSDMVQFVNGFVYVTHDNGTGYVQTPAVNYIPPDAWNVVETRRDLTGDGYADIQITSDDGYGSTWVATLRNDYLQTGCITLNYQFIGAYNNELWRYLGSADFNGDGKAEILMVQTEAGKDPYGHRNVAAWVTDAETCEWIDNIWLGALNDGWDVAGTADVTGDGRDNLILRGADGMIGYWAEFEGQPEDVVELKNAGNRVLVTTGDFDGDGAEDFLWQSATGNEFSTWTDVNGTLTDTVIGKASDLGGSWTFAGVGDYNADGKAEILWCDTVNYKTAYSEANKANFANLVALS